MAARRGCLTALVLVALGATAFAELDAGEKKWLKQCLDSLVSKSAKVREGAEVAIGKLGLDAIPVLLPDVGRLKTDDDWAALARALSVMDRSNAADMVNLSRDKWPKGQEQRLGKLVEALRKGPVPGPGAAPGKASPEIEAKVRELLEPFRGVHSYSSRDPAVAKVVALGRDAIPALAAILRENDDHGAGMLVTATKDALADLVTEADVPLLAQLLADGHLAAAGAFKNLRSPAALDALLDTVKRGFVSYDLVEQFDHFRDDPQIAPALIGWLEAHGESAGWEVSPVARYLGEHRVREAVPALSKLLGAGRDAHARTSAAVALARFGEKSGVETLVEIFEAPAAGPGRSDDHVRHEAGEELNKIAGRRIYTGSFEPSGGIRGNADDAAKLFREWWNGVKDKIRFDATRRVWLTE